VLFDIDGTLLLSGGAGVRSMTIAFEATFGVADAFADMLIAGRTDTYLLSAAFGRAGLPDTADAHARFHASYLPILTSEIRERGRGRYGVMPGVQTLLTVLEERDDVHVALLTGNYQQAARIKLDHFGLNHFFKWGVFGEESADRNVLGRLALARAEARNVPLASRENPVVIGDTPDDIACAHAAGALALAVATGSYSLEQLQEAGADVVLPDLSDTDVVLETIRSSRRTRVAPRSTG
jgi:phosphoglycolate phosphatase-like HAD superfamily hydrolase